MTLAELLEIVRNELDDTVEPYLWSDAELTEFANDAESEAVRRGRLLVDSTTPEVCTVGLTTGTSLYELDCRIIRVNRVKHGDNVLRPIMVRDLDAMMPGWESLDEDPLYWCPDFETGKIRLVGSPQANGNLNLQVVRLPLDELRNSYDSFEIRPTYQKNLRHWITYRAYMKRDSETYNPQKAAESLSLFTAEFGASRPAYDEMWMIQYYGQDSYDGRY